MKRSIIPFLAAAVFPLATSLAHAQADATGANTPTAQDANSAGAAADITDEVAAPSDANNSNNPAGIEKKEGPAAASENRDVAEERPPAEPNETQPVSTSDAVAQGPEAPSPEMSNTSKKKNDKASEAPLDPNRTEWAILPVFGGNSDIGVIFGLGVVLAKFSPEKIPYKWRIDANASAAAASRGITMQNYRINFNLPQVLSDRLRIIGSASYIQLNDKGYYGIGNLSQYQPSDSSSRYVYNSKVPEVWTNTEVDLGKHFDFLGGIRFRYSILESEEGSLLDEHMSYTDDNGKLLLPGTDNHGELVFAAGVSYDTRNHEYAPTKGMFHQITTRGSPGPMTGTDYSWGGSTAIFRFYYSFWGEYLTLATRLMGDIMYGTPPFYEMAIAGAFPYFSAIGGMFGIRGVPDGRYYGGVKILGNFEVRTVFIKFALKKHRFKLGLAAFFDTGRVWTELKSRPELDGDGIGMKFGTGGGLRAQWGETFMARIDFAYSPDANPLGVYFAVGHMF